jgi:hypothetical protein
VEVVTSAQEQVARCWHPEPAAPLIQARNGSNIEVLAGDPAYQFSSGRKVVI